MVGKKVIIENNGSECEVEILDKLIETYGFYNISTQKTEYGQRTAYLVCDSDGRTFNILPDRIIRIVKT